MLKKEVLCKVIDPNLVDEGSSSFVFVEASNSTHGLTNVHFNISADFLCLKDKFSKGHPAHITQIEEVHFQKDCDITLLIKKGECNYLVWVEVKTSVKDVYKDAIFKFSGCYYKTKLLLDSFESFDDAEYKEVGIVVYAKNPPKPQQTVLVNNAQYMDSKARIVAQPKTRHQLLSDKYKPYVESGGMFIMVGSDFGTSTLPLKPKYVLSNLPMVAVPVDYNNPIVEIDAILSLLQHVN